MEGTSSEGSIGDSDSIVARDGLKMDGLGEDKWVAEKVRERLREGEPQTNKGRVCTGLGWKDIFEPQCFRTVYLKIRLTSHRVRLENSKRLSRTPSQVT